MLGILFYIIPIYVAGVPEGLMWKQFNKDGFLQYPNFLEVVQSILPMYMLRALGGMLYITGAVLMAFNLYKTAKSGQFVAEQEAQAAPLTREGAGGSHEHGHRWLEAKPL